MLVVTELVGVTTPLEQMVASAWSLAPPEEEKEVPVDGADTGGPGKRLALELEVERARGWKETAGDIGPWDDVRLETIPAGESKGKHTHSGAGIRGLEKVPLPQLIPSLQHQGLPTSCPVPLVAAPRPESLPAAGTSMVLSVLSL